MSSDPLRVLAKARAFISGYRDELLRSYCVMDADDEPIRETANEADAHRLQCVDALLAEIDNALNEGTEE